RRTESCCPRRLARAPRAFRVDVFAAEDHQAGKVGVDFRELGAVVIHAEEILDRGESLCCESPFMAAVVWRVGSISLTADFIAPNSLAPSAVRCCPSSFDIDHITIDGWFRCWSTIALTSDRSSYGVVSTAFCAYVSPRCRFSSITSMPIRSAAR